MDTTGTILEVNQAFLSSFGYQEDDILQEHLRILFTDEDRKMNKPEREVEKANVEGSCSDDNYLIQKSGKPVWVNGESILVTGDNNVSFIIKIIHNIEAQKQLERFLLDSNDFIETILESITDRGMMILDSSIKVVKVNSKLLEIFGLQKYPDTGSRISTLDHPFWHSNEIKQVLRNIMVRDEPIGNMPMEYQDANGDRKYIELTSKFLQARNAEKRLLLVIKEAQK